MGFMQNNHEIIQYLWEIKIVTYFLSSKLM